MENKAWKDNNMLNRLKESSTDELLDKLNSMHQYWGRKGENGLGNLRVDNQLKIIDEFKSIVSQFPVGIIISHKIDSGIEYFKKISDNHWELRDSPWRSIRKMMDWDVARLMAEEGYITRGPYEIYQGGSKYSSYEGDLYPKGWE